MRRPESHIWPVLRVDTCPTPHINARRIFDVLWCTAKKKGNRFTLRLESPPISYVEHSARSFAASRVCRSVRVPAHATCVRPAHMH
jgi:hypothetical protein